MYLLHLLRSMKSKSLSGFWLILAWKGYFLIIFTITIVDNLYCNFRSGSGTNSQEKKGCTKYSHGLGTGCSCKKDQECINGVCGNGKCQGNLLANDKLFFFLI